MEYLWWVLIFFTGAAVGSFLNVCICRMPVNESVVYPPSHCPACGEKLWFGDLVPILSYLFLKGRCRYCDCRIAWQYPVVEFATGFLFVLAVAKYGLTMGTLRTIVLFSIIIPAMAIDLKYKIIPDRLNLAGVLFGIPLICESKEVFITHGIGFLAGGGLLLLIALASRGGMGGGDIKLVSVIGLLLGWKLLLPALFLAFLTGGVVGITMLLVKKIGRKDPVPFGPYLAIGAVLAALAGDQMIGWYLGLTGAF
ncbi:MAG: prepilin peptidase [Desulfotomaculaceae bacterium]|nr:prepilin peptidase [Desulfotomaculaceae bacterium]